MAPKEIFVSVRVKTCTACDEIKGESLFRKGHNQCKDCERVRRRELRKRHKENFDINNLPTKKRCPSCGETKPREDWPINRTNTDGLGGICNDCLRESQSIYYHVNGGKEVKDDYKSTPEAKLKDLLRNRTKRLVKGLDKRCIICAAKSECHHPEHLKEDYTEEDLERCASSFWFLCKKHHMEVHFHLPKGEHTSIDCEHYLESFVQGP